MFVKILSHLKIVSHNHTGDICPKQSSAGRIDCVRLHGVSSPLGQLMSAATHIRDFTSLQCNANTQIHKYTNTQIHKIHKYKYKYTVDVCPSRIEPTIATYSYDMHCVVEDILFLSIHLVCKNYNKYNS